MRPELNLELSANQAKLYYRKQISSDRTRGKITFHLQMQFMAVKWAVILPTEKAETYCAKVDHVLEQYGINVISKIRERIFPLPTTNYFLVTVAHLYSGKNHSTDDDDDDAVHARDFKPMHTGPAFDRWVKTLKSALGVGNTTTRELFVYGCEGLRPKMHDWGKR